MHNSIPVISVTGDGREVGRAHARATVGLRDEVLAGVERARSDYSTPVVKSELAEVIAALSVHSPDTIEQLEGMGEVYGVSPEDLLLSSLQTYFWGRTLAQRPMPNTADHGCSVYSFSEGRNSLLVKNRDSSPAFLHMQTVLHVADQSSYSWSALSTAGAPGVHSGGINEHGLGVVDTHVPSRNSGPGVPRFSTMMMMLQQCKTVNEAIELHREVSNMGYGNLVVADEFGHSAVIESGFERSAYINLQRDHLVATNHFVASGMAETCLFSERDVRGEDSRKRRKAVDDSVGSLGVAVLEDATAPMREHDPAGFGSVCVHDHKASSTISTIVIRPSKRQFGVVLGNPCSGEIVDYSAWA